MHLRFPSRACLPTLLLSLISVPAFGQSVAAVDPAPDAPAKAEAKSFEIKPDLNDPTVVRAQQNVDRVRGLVQTGVLPTNDLGKAMDDLNDALDSSILRYAAFNQDLLPEQADQVVGVAQRIYLRRQARSNQIRQLAANGVLSRAEAEMAGTDVLGAKLQLDLAIERAGLVKDMARLRASVESENEAEAHPEWNGKLYTRYDGKGAFDRSDFDKVSAAFLAAFGHAIPVSADGQTAVHRAMGFNHTGRVDVALNPDQREGVWLLSYLQRNHIPYFAFKAAIAHKATGAHIHLGPGSTKLSATSKTCCATSGY